jgi:hypothetical protein
MGENRDLEPEDEGSNISGLNKYKSLENFPLDEILSEL